MVGEAWEARKVVEENTQLAESLERLSDVLPGELSLKEFLQQVAEHAASAVPGAEGAALRLQEGNRSELAVFTNQLVAELDALQHRIGQGPCVTAAREGGTICSGSLGEDGRWPDLGPRAALMGVQSALSLPLVAPEGVVGAFNFYARRKDAFGDRSALLAELFAIPAAIAVRDAEAIAHVKDLAAQLQTELSSNKVMNETIGVLISRYQIGAADLLRRSRAANPGQQR